MSMQQKTVKNDGTDLKMIQGLLEIRKSIIIP